MSFHLMLVVKVRHVEYSCRVNDFKWVLQLI